VLERLRVDDLRGTRATQIIARQTQHLARLMDDLLDVGRVVTGKITLERRPMDLLAAARRALATLRAAGVTERHDVAVDGRPVWVDGDTTRMDQIVTNLVSNALKFTPSGGTIRVWVGVEDDGAVLRVSDTGAGMSPELLPRIFDLFVQGDQPPERTSGGLGIGLTLVRQLVELHGGRVEARSAGAGQGMKMIALTGYGQSEDMRMAREAGFDLHLVKPVGPRRLDEALRALLPAADQR